MADALAAECDFLSIGTNDLTQYALAMDRGNPAVAGSIDGLDPAVLRLIGLCCEGAESHGKWVGVCGGLASDPLAVPILIGLGVTELSAAPAMVPEIKALVRALSSQDCRPGARSAPGFHGGASARAGNTDDRGSGPVNNALQHLQSLGRALMLPIAVLPVAALLLRLGQPDLLGLDFVSAAGNAMFANLGLLFAIGVATGFAKDGNGAAPLAGVVCFLVATEGAKALLRCRQTLPRACRRRRWPPSRPPGAARRSIMSRCRSALSQGSSGASATIASRASSRRNISPSSAAGGSCRSSLAWPGWRSRACSARRWAASMPVPMPRARRRLASGGVGLFIFGLLNRLLLVTGLHHILNNIAWFVLGDFHGTTGDLRRFFAGDPTARAFMSGFFPVMMFGLPAACLAMYHSARPDRRKATGGMLLSLAATSFLTGVTEPIEFSFMFLAPLLYALHAVLTGAAMALMAALGVHLGFGFSAGLFDYVLNFSKAQKPLLLIPVGLAYAGVYYGCSAGPSCGSI
jgi:PTS system N-acetylglucosamine-specific IIC component